MPNRKIYILWRPPTREEGHSKDEKSEDEEKDENESSASSISYEALLGRSSSKPPRKSLGRLCANALVVNQEICLTTYLLQRHNAAMLVEEHGQFKWALRRVHKVQRQLERSTYLIGLALLVVLYFSAKAERAPPQSRKTKVRQRLVDGILLAVILRFLASLLRSLTASYSSDTVQALAHALMVLHLLACDYSYANGKEPLGCMSSTSSTTTSTISTSSQQLKQQQHKRRPPFQGGTISLNAALLATTLLVSRLKSNLVAFFLICIAIVLFAFYPVPRNAIAASYPPHSSPVMWIITSAILAATIVLITDDVVVADDDMTNYNHNQQLAFFVCLLFCFGFLIPCWKYVAQSHKRLLRGPWDIPKASSMKLDYYYYYSE